MFRRIITVFVVLLVLALIAAAGLSYFYNSMMDPVDPAAGEEEIIVDIPPGSNVEIVASILYDHGLIQNELVFRFYVRRHGLDQGFIAGQYSLSPAMDAEQIAEKIQAGEVYSETVWFTIPEGYTLKQIADRLEEKGLVDSEQFLDFAADPPAAIKEKYPFLQEIESSEIDYLLEGYLFPDTYEVYADAGVQEIAEIMLRRTAHVIEGKNGARIGEQEYSLHEILTIASMVEREARVDHERRRIAGVIYNRLDIGQRLQIDATIQYILGETKEFLTYDDLEVESPYNTYLNDGLPPGPIAAPGKPSIEGAFYPEDTDYFYYNYKYDDTGEHYFSHTYQEHRENVRRARENREQSR